MKILSWNVHGLGNPRVVCNLRNVLRLYNPQVVFFMETKRNVIQITKIRRSFSFLYGIDVSASGSRGGLCLA